MVPQSSISQTIKKLEKEIGITLFDRKGNKVALNENGRIFQSAVESSFVAIEDAKRMIKENINANSGELRLLIRTNRRLVTECIADFRARFPNVTFSLDHNPFRTDYENFDMVVSEEVPDLKLFEKDLLVSENILLAVSRNHPMSERDSISIASLAAERFISMPLGSSLRKILMEICYNNGFEPNITIEIDDPYYLRRYVEIGLGIALVPEVSWQNLFNNTVALVKFEDFSLKRNTYVYRDLRRNSPAILKSFHSSLLEHCRVNNAISEHHIDTR
jgi:DNA-binding transcriptional LysR family regulator